MFVLGIDPGLTRCGYGLVEGSFRGVESFRAVRAGIIETSHETAVEKRLGQVLVELRALLEETKPDAVVVERVFYQRNAKTAIPVAQASGVAVALAGALELPVRQFNAQEVKLAVTGYGAASKSQVQGMVARLCGLAEIPKPADAADALALAITYFMVVRSERRTPWGTARDRLAARAGPAPPPRRRGRARRARRRLRGARRVARRRFASVTWSTCSSIPSCATTRSCSTDS